MSSSTRRHIDLVLRDAVKEYTHALNARLQAIYSGQAARGGLRSGTTVQLGIELMDQLVCEAVQSTSAKVLDIGRDAEAFSAFRTAIYDIIEFYREAVPGVLGTALGAAPRDAAETAAFELFNELESKIERKLEIAQFQFSAAEQSSAPEVAKERSSKTGRRPSPFWDEMWASIARDLYEGDLKPQTQADIETAMLRWIESHGHSAAVSTVRARARRLWDQICDQ